MSGVLLRHPDSLLLSGSGPEAYINFRDGSSLNMKSATLGRRHVSTQVRMYLCDVICYRMDTYTEFDLATWYIIVKFTVLKISEFFKFGF